MDPIISNAIAAQQSQVQMEVQTSVLKKSIEGQKMIGELAIGLIEAASAPVKGLAIDSGQNLDLFG